MSAPVTEAHRVITESVCELLDSEEMIGPSPVERAAQLIADSEARAVAEIAMVAAASADRNVSLRLERDQLRAECLNLRADLDAIKAIRDEEKARAASAEREVERLKPYVSKAVLTHDGTMLCSPMVAVKFNEETTRAERAEADADSTRERALTLANSLDEAQAELATERGRLNWILRLCATGAFYRAESRAAIDAAMKRGTK